MRERYNVIYNPTKRCPDRPSHKVQHVLITEFGTRYTLIIGKNPPIKKKLISYHLKKKFFSPLVSLPLEPLSPGNQLPSLQAAD